MATKYPHPLPRRFKPSLELVDGVSLGHLNEAKAGNGGFSFAALLGGSAPASKPAADAADVFIIINATCVELPNVQQYIESNSSGSKVAVVWNLELDTLRGDLGLLSFPPKDMHYSFLSTLRPVFYLRPRDYSKSVAVAPFIVNYSGALFREYPGPWQVREWMGSRGRVGKLLEVSATVSRRDVDVSTMRPPLPLQVMLKQDSGEYACIAEDPLRYNLGDVKEEMQAAMGLNTEVSAPHPQGGIGAAGLRNTHRLCSWMPLIQSY